MSLMMELHNNACMVNYIKKRIAREDHGLGLNLQLKSQTSDETSNSLLLSRYDHSRMAKELVEHLLRLRNCHGALLQPK